MFFNTGYSPIYKSINYSTCNEIKNYNETDLPIVNISEHGDIPLIHSCEYSWFNNGSSIFVLPELNFKYTNKKRADGTYKLVKDIVNDLISEYYNASGELLDFLVSLYNYKSSWEYVSDTNIDDYLYTIELTLK